MEKYLKLSSVGVISENAIKKVFSKLEENVDEGMRKELISHFKETIENIRSEEIISHSAKILMGKMQKYIAWLEKQCEKIKPIEGFNTEFERQVSYLIASAINKEYEYTSGYVKWVANGLLEYAKHEIKNDMGISEATQKKLRDNLSKALEKETSESLNEFLDEQSEQESNPCDRCINHKGCINCENGELRETERIYPFYMNNPNIKSWTIQEAKDGDVIFYDNGWTCIFKDIHGIWYSSYCFITADGEFHTGYERHAIDAKINGNANPATKEQRDILFARMKEAGYEWDAEKKELKKIEQENPDTLIEESNQQRADDLIDMVTEEKDMTEYNKGFECGKQRVLKYPEDYGLCKKIAWSEEDEKRSISLHNAIYVTQDCAVDSNKKKELSDFLDSLKNRVQQQSKQEWSKEDKKCMSLSTDIIDSALRAGFCVQLDRDRCIDWFNSLKDRIQPQQGWDKDDDKHCDRILKELREQKQKLVNVPYIDLIDSDIDWLKSLKDRYTWKPSEEQMDALDKGRIYIPTTNIERKFIESLFEDLKKLREE